jgi:hypothetical protein
MYEGVPVEINKENLKRATSMYFTRTMTFAKPLSPGSEPEANDQG